MNTLPFSGYEALAITPQMTSTRCPFRIADHSGILRSLVVGVRSMLNSADERRYHEPRDAAFCELRPAECRDLS